MTNASEEETRCRPLQHIGRAVFMTVAFAVLFVGKVQAESSNEGPEKIQLGGLEQWILIRGYEPHKPVLLFLHGGPGVPIIPFFRDLDQHAKLEQLFTMVYWDQRGAGKSFDRSIPPQSMNIEQFVADTRDLTQLIKKRFDVERIYLMGHSWGTVLGVLTAHRYPELYHMYIGIGQVVDMQENERVSYELVYDHAQQKQNRKALQDLKSIGPPPYPSYKEMIVEREWAKKFSRSFKGRSSSGLISGHDAPEPKTEFRLPNWLHGPYFSMKHLWTDLHKVNLFVQAPKLEIPVLIFAGKYDYLTPTSISERYLQQLEAPKGKRIVIFEQSGHTPFTDEPNKFYEEIAANVARIAE